MKRTLFIISILFCLVSCGNRNKINYSDHPMNSTEKLKEALFERSETYYYYYSKKNGYYIAREDILYPRDIKVEFYSTGEKKIYAFNGVISIPPQQNSYAADGVLIEMYGEGDSNLDFIRKINGNVVKVEYLTRDALKEIQNFSVADTISVADTTAAVW